MGTEVIFWLLVVAAYLFGSIPFGKIVARHYGIDIQKHGSGNIGYANVHRTLGWKPGLIVLAGDVLKGYIPVLVAVNHCSTYQIMAVGLAAILGHIFPVWLRFKGGKGIATGLGITLAISPWLGLLGGAIYLLAIVVLRKSAPSSLIAAWSLVIFSTVLAQEYFWFYIGLALVAMWTHRANIRKVLAKH